MQCQKIAILFFYGFVLPLFEGLYLASMLILANFKYMQSMANQITQLPYFGGGSSSISQDSYFRLLIASGSINAILLIIHLIHVIGYRAGRWKNQLEVSRFDYALFLTGFPGCLLSAISIMNDGINTYDEIAYYLQYTNICIAAMQKIYESMKNILEQQKKTVIQSESTHQITMDA